MALPASLPRLANPDGTPRSAAARARWVFHTLVRCSLTNRASSWRTTA
jgi:hypothetical protein